MIKATDRRKSLAGDCGFLSAEREREILGMTWACETSKANPSDMLSPTETNLLINAKVYQLRTKSSQKIAKRHCIQA